MVLKKEKKEKIMKKYAQGKGDTGSPEVQVSFDRDKLNKFGLRLGEVSETVRSKVRGRLGRSPIFSICA